MKKYKDRVGEKHNELTIIGYIIGTKNKAARFSIECECGKSKSIICKDVLSGHSKTCGCNKIEVALKNLQYIVPKINQDRRDHPLSYSSWVSMLARVTDERHIFYKHYGARGITIDTRWYDFKEFYKDMGDRPRKGMSLERIDNDKGYSKENCKWATTKEQSRNRRNSKPQTYKGETLFIQDWSERYNVPVRKLYKLVDSGRFESFLDSIS